MDVGSVVYQLILHVHVFINFVNLIKVSCCCCFTTVVQNSVSIVSPLGHRQRAYVWNITFNVRCILKFLSGPVHIWSLFAHSLSSSCMKQLDKTDACLWNFANSEVTGEVSAPLFSLKSCAAGLVKGHPRRLIMMTSTAAVILTPVTWLLPPLWEGDEIFKQVWSCIQCMQLGDFTAHLLLASL